MTRAYLVAGFAGVAVVVALVAAWDCGRDAGRYERARVLCGLEVGR